MKKLLKFGLIFGGGVMVLVFAVIGIVFLMTGESADNADALFARIAEGDIQGAYDSTAPQLRAVQSLAEFQAAAESLGLTRYAGASWNSREISGDRTVLEGTVTLDDGNTVRMRVVLAETGEAWQVVSFTSPDFGPTLGGGLPSLPELAAARALTQATLGMLDRAIKQGDFNEFYQGSATLWQAETSPEDLQAAFQSFIDAGTDLSGVVAAQPEFSSPPSRDPDGALVLVGYATAGGDVLHFRLRYVYEHPEWRLIGLHVGDAPFDGAG